MIGVTIWLIISAILFVVCLIVLAYLYKRGFKDAEWNERRIGLFSSGVMLFGFSVALASTFWASGNSHYEKHVCNILSVRNEEGIEGHFCLGTGSVKNVQYYLYYYQADRGVRMGKVEAARTYIIETNAYEPCLYHVKNKGEFFDFYELYVPEGTLILSYTLS